MKIKRKLISLTLILTVFMISFTGCKKTEPEKKKETITDYSDLSFDEFLNQMFKEDVTSDLTIFTQMIENPEDYGITAVPTRIEPFTKEAYDKETKQCEARLEALESYDYNALSDSQKQDYDLIKSQLELRIEMADLFYYSEPLSTVDGIQIVAPAVLGLHTSRYFQNLAACDNTDPKAVETYFDIYDAMEEYLKEAAKFEKEKAEQGFFMSANSASAVVKTCEEVINNNAEEFSDGFAEEIEVLEYLTDEQKKELIKKNDKMCSEKICAGYQAIIDVLKKCAKQDKIGVPLYETPEGKRYYSYLLKQKTSCFDSVEETITELESYLLKWSARKEEIEKEQPDILEEINKICTISDENLIAALNNGREHDFPKLALSWGLDQMPKQCDGFAMGLYYASALDSSQSVQNVYVGSNATRGSSYFIETVGHEGVPGHLYHYNYIKQLPLSDYRKFFGWNSYLGYLEGWTTYIEQFAYSYAGLTELQAEYLELSRLIELGIVQRLDIGVNYEGWDFEKIGTFLKDYPAYVILAGYLKDNVEQSPCMSASYVIGFIKMTEIKEIVKEKMGDDFSDLAFHELYLKQGPADFDTLRTLLK